MANASQLNLKLGIDVSSLDRELGKVEKSLSKFGNSMKNIGTNLTQSLTVPIIGLGIASVKAFSDMEKLEKGLTAIMGSSKLAKDEIVKLREVAKLPGLGLKEAVQGSINLQAVGLSAEEAKSTLMGFGTALAAVGKGKVELEAIQYQLTQMISKNKLLAEDYKVIQSNLPLMAEGMRAAFGTSNIDAIRETGISAKDFTLQLSNALSLLPQTQNVTGGLANSFENLSDNIFISLNELGKTINETLKLEEVFTKISDKIQMMVDKFKALSPAQQENIVKFALFAAAIGPIILVVGQLATSISSIIALTRTLLTLFSIAASATGIGALTLAVVGLGIAYYNTSDGQKTINYTGATLLKTFGHLKDVFSNIIKLLGHLTPLFNYLLKVVFDSINQIFKFFNLIYEIADVLDKAIEKFLGINQKQKGANNTNPVKNEMGFGGGLPGKQNNAGGSWGDEKKKTTTTTDSPEVAAMKAKIKALEDLLKKSTKVKSTPELKGNSTLDEIKKMQTNKSMMEFDMLNLNVNALPTLDLIPKKLESITAANERLKETNLALANSFEAITHRVTSVEVALTPMQNILVAATDAFSNMAMQGETDMKKLGSAAMQAARMVISAYIKEGVAGIIKGILGGPLSKTLGPGALAVAGAAGAGAAVLFNTLLNKVSPPKLAQGGLAYGPTMATVGDNRNASVDPEVIAPLSKLRGMLDGGGSPYVLSTRVSGADLIVIMEKARNVNTRIR
jgi:tape measure domain-containing protein